MPINDPQPISNASHPAPSARGGGDAAPVNGAAVNGAAVSGAAVSGAAVNGAAVNGAPVSGAAVSDAGNLTPLLDTPRDFVHGVRWPLYDVLRALAVLMVVFGHVTFRMPDNTIGGGGYYIIRQMGLIGVDMFLILSGFFTAGFLFTEHRESGSISLERFFTRRFFKLYPTYILVLIITFVWVFHGGHGSASNRLSHTMDDTWTYFAHLQNYFEPNSDLYIHTWTLVLIIQFYLAFALLAYVLAKLSPGSANPFKVVPWLFLASLPVCYLLRYLAARSVTQYSPWTNNFPLQLRADEFLCGAAIAYGVVYARPLMRRMARFWPLILLLSAAALLPVALRRDDALPYLRVWAFTVPGIHPVVDARGGAWFLYTWGFTLAGMGCAGFLFLAWAVGHAGNIRAGRWLPVRVLAFLGLGSYSIYIWHMPFGQWLGYKLGTRLCDMHIWPHRGHLMSLWGSPWQFLVLALAYVAVSLAASLFMWFILERPGLLLRDLWFRRKRAEGFEPIMAAKCVG